MSDEVTSALGEIEVDRENLYREDREICGIQPLEDRCHFYLTRGEAMKDPDRLLEGNSKGIRHIKVRSVKDMPVGAIKKFIREGKKRNGNHKEREQDQVKSYFHNTVR